MERKSRRKKSIAEAEVLDFGLIRNSAEKTLLPALSESSLHNYFAEKMAAFSIIMGYLSEKSFQPITGKPFKKVYNKLEKRRRIFLVRYHKLSRSAGSRFKSQTERLKAVFDLVHRFEKEVVREILVVGVKPADMIELNNFSLATAVNQ